MNLEKKKILKRTLPLFATDFDFAQYNAII